MKKSHAHEQVREAVLRFRISPDFSRTCQEAGLSLVKSTSGECCCHRGQRVIHEQGRTVLLGILHDDLVNNLGMELTSADVVEKTEIKAGKTTRFYYLYLKYESGASTDFLDSLNGSRETVMGVFARMYEELDAFLNTDHSLSVSAKALQQGKAPSRLTTLRILSTRVLAFQTEGRSRPEIVENVRL